jgi:hypothetical protein
MRDTRYWKKDNTQGGYWSKCRDQSLNDEQAGDGRVLHKYTKPFPGERWQYKTENLFGNIESIWIDNGQYGEDLKIGLQHEQGVDVLRIPVWRDKSNGKLNTDFKGFAKKIPNISVHSPITLSTWINTKGARTWKDPQGNEHTNIPIYITMQQGGANVASAFEWKDGKYVGIPDAESAKIGDKTYFDYTKQNDFFLDLVNGFISESMEIFESRIASRSSTPAEQEKQEAKNIPVTASVADDDDDMPW